MPKLTTELNKLRTAIRGILDAPRFSTIPTDRRVALVVEFLWQWLSEQDAPQPNRGEPWSDDALRVILQEAPTHANIVKLARAFGRSPGSVEQIYRWAATTDKRIAKKRPDDAFVSQIKRVAKEIGWEAF
jgi:hypothetical protein